MRAGSLTTVVLATLILSAAASACGAAGRSAVPLADRALLLSYREEGGIGGARPSLLVSRSAAATLRLGGCRAEWTLGRALWGRLRSTLRRARLGSIAGTYPPAAGAADAITYVVRSGADEVRVAPAPIARNEAVLSQLGPLLEVVGRAVAVGERRLAPGCPSPGSAG